MDALTAATPSAPASPQEPTTRDLLLVGPIPPPVIVSQQAATDTTLASAHDSSVSNVFSFLAVNTYEPVSPTGIILGNDQHWLSSSPINQIKTILHITLIFANQSI